MTGSPRVTIIGSSDDPLARATVRGLAAASVSASIIGLADWVAGVEIADGAVRFRGGDMPSVLLRDELATLAGAGFAGAEICAAAWSALAMSASPVINPRDPTGPHARRDLHRLVRFAVPDGPVGRTWYASRLESVRSDLAVRDLTTGSTVIVEASGHVPGTLSRAGSVKFRGTRTKAASYQVVTVLGDDVWVRDDAGDRIGVIGWSHEFASVLGLCFATFTWECGDGQAPLLVRCNEFPRAWEMGRRAMTAVVDRLCAELAPGPPGDLGHLDCSTPPAAVEAPSFFPASHVIDVVSSLADADEVSLADAAEREYRRRTERDAP